MYYIDDYKKNAINVIIPYLIEFPQIVSIIETSADRYQAIEDIIWEVANNFKVDDARGVFLDALAHNETASLVLSDKADDAFTYGTDKPLKQAYGTGHYYSLASYLGGSRKDISTDKMIRSIKAKIIENNTNCTLSDFIEALQLFYNATDIKILESNPLNISVMLKCDESELLTQGNEDIIKSLLPACVYLDNLYYNTGTYNINQNGISNLGLSRYPRNIKDGLLNFPDYYQSFELKSNYNEYIKTNYASFEEGMFCCITGEVTSSYVNNVFLSSNNGTNNFYIGIDNNNKFTLSGTTTNIDAVAGKEYTFILYNSGSKLNLWIDNSITIDGQDVEKDSSYIMSKIQYKEPTVYINNFTTFEADIYINALNSNGTLSYGDFNYYSIIFGNIDDSTINVDEYYITSCGQKEVLFNCMYNTNHLLINSSISSEHVDPIEYQSSFLYSKAHGNGMYAYFDSISDITYKMLTEDSNEQVTTLNISFDICPLFDNSTSNLLYNFVGDSAHTSNIQLTDNREIVVTIPLYNPNLSTYLTVVLTSDTQIDENNFNNIKLEYKNNKLLLYINNELKAQENINGYIILGIPQNLTIGNKFLGFIKNVDIIVNNNELKSVFTNTLRTDNNSNVNNIIYTNNGVKLITTPQLYNDTTNTDLYGNALIGLR